MYEIWLALNIVYEIARSLWPLIAVGLGLWLVLLWVAGGRMGRHAVGLSLGVGVVAAVVAFLVVPSLTRSSLANMGYWVDWVVLAGLALGAGCVAAVGAFPLISLMRKPR